MLHIITILIFIAVYEYIMTLSSTIIFYITKNKRPQLEYRKFTEGVFNFRKKE